MSVLIYDPVGVYTQHTVYRLCRGRYCQQGRRPAGKLLPEGCFQANTTEDIQLLPLR